MDRPAVDELAGVQIHSRLQEPGHALDVPGRDQRGCWLGFRRPVGVSQRIETPPLVCLCIADDLESTGAKQIGDDNEANVLPPGAYYDEVAVFLRVLALDRVGSGCCPGIFCECGETLAALGLRKPCHQIVVIFRHKRVPNGIVSDMLKVVNRDCIAHLSVEQRRMR